MNNSIKEKIQQKEFAALKDSHNVILRWATGVGKSHETIMLINNAQQTLNKKCRVLLVIAERAHKDNWDAEFTKWSLDKSKFTITTICYASLKKHYKEEYDIIILDECHHSFTDLRLEVLSTIKSKYVFALSATLPTLDIALFEKIWGHFNVSNITMKKAIDNNVLPEPKVNLIKLELDSSKQDQVIKYSRANRNSPTVKFEDRWKYIKAGTPCNILCTEKQKYQYYTDNMEYWKNRYIISHNEFQRNKWLNIASARKRFIGDLKIRYAYKLVKSIPINKRFICFCSSILQCSALGGKNVIHSKQSNNMSVIANFNDKKINSLFAVGMANEGMNLNDIQIGIIIQLDGNERSFIQKYGRAMRADNPVQYIFYYKDTQDEVYLKNALENIDSKFIVNLDINQITI